MQKLFDSGMVKTTKFISITPRMLRTIADRMDQASKSQFITANDSIYVDVAEGLTFYYEPSLDGKVFQTILQSNSDEFKPKALMEASKEMNGI